MPSAVTDSLKIYDILKSAQLSEMQTRSITQAIQQSESAVAADVRSVLDERLQHLATKADLAVLRTEMAELRSELLRWMFGFWVAQMAATVGIIFTAFKLWK